MTIYRDEKAIELTKEELYAAYKEQLHNNNEEYVLSAIGYFIYVGSLPKEAAENSKLISFAAEEMQYKIDAYGFDRNKACGEAVSKIFLPYYEHEELTFDELREKLREAEKTGEHITGIIVFDQCSFKKDYTEEERSYRVSSDNNAFKSGKISNSIYGDCLDGKDLGVRLDLYMYDGWKVEKCYIEKV